MSNTAITLLFLASFILLMGLGGAALLIDSANRARRRLDARLEAVVPPPPSTDAMPTVRIAVKQSSGLERVLSYVSCDLALARYYPAPWWVAPIVAAVVARAAAWLLYSLVGALSWVALPIVWFIVCRSIFRAWNAKRRDRMLQQFPDALGMVTRTVRVGLPVLEGIRLVGREAPDPTGAEFRQLVEELVIGVPLDVALRVTAQRLDMPEYRFFATAVALQAQTGGGLSEALDTLGDVVRKRLALRSRGFAMTSEARTSAWVLAVMPFFVAVMTSFTSPGFLDPLFDTTLGNEMMSVGALSLCIGIATMRAMIRRTLS